MTHASDDSASGGGEQTDVTAAIRGAQFFLLYQPTMDLRSGAFVGVEALLRWRHPQRGVLTPDAFLAQLEADGSMLEVGAWVLEEASRQGADWHSRGHRFVVSVNLSARQLHDDGLPTTVEQALNASGFDAGHLVLEVSAPLLLESPELGPRLDALHELGVKVAVDDFGADAASSELLRRFPVDIVKIDRSFLSEVGSSAQAASQLHDLVQLGRSLNVQTIAQGIEDDDQRLRLQGESVDVGQGFLFSVPHEAAEIDAYLEDFSIFSGEPL